jgi:Flp pilus assembly protein TadB
VAQTKRKRRRKHRGTQTGRIDSRHRGRPRTREEAKARAKSKKRPTERREVVPSWSSALKRGLFGAAIFLILMVAAFGRSFGEALLLSVVMLAMYVPLGYYVDRFFYNRRRSRERQQKAARSGR